MKNLKFLMVLLIGMISFTTFAISKEFAEPKQKTEFVKTDFVKEQNFEAVVKNSFDLVVNHSNEKNGFSFKEKTTTISSTINQNFLYQNGLNYSSRCKGYNYNCDVSKDIKHKNKFRYFLLC